MKRTIITLAILGAVTVGTVMAVKKINQILEYVDSLEDDGEGDLPEGVEGFKPTSWIPKNLPPHLQAALDEALAKFPEGWVQRGRPQRKDEV